MSKALKGRFLDVKENRPDGESRFMEGLEDGDLPPELSPIRHKGSDIPGDSPPKKKPKPASNKKRDN